MENGDTATGAFELTADLDEGSLTGNVKNDESKPSFEKKIADINDSTDADYSDWQDSADHDIGDKVPYQLKATLPDNVSDYYKYHITFEDEMDAGLTFNTANGITSVKVDGTEVNNYVLSKAGNGFTLTLTWEGEKDESDATKYTKTIGETSLGTSLNSKVVEVLFNATLNKDANLGAQGNVNRARLEYSNNCNLDSQGHAQDTNDNDKGKTDWDYTIAFTYKVEVNKVKNDGTTALTGAEFKLEKMLADGTTEEITGADRVSVSGNVFTFKGLDDGKYILTETKVPNGYKRIDPIEFTVAAAHHDTAESDAKLNWVPENGSTASTVADVTRSGVLTGLTGTVTDGVVALPEFTADNTYATLTGNVKNTEATKPEFTKKVQDINDSTDTAYSEWQDSADHDIGDDVPYRLTAKLADNVSDYYKYHITFTDEMDEGLTFNAANGITSVKVGDTVISPKTDANPTGYMLSDTSAHGFRLTLTWEAAKDDQGKYTGTLSDDLNEAEVEVLFTATLNENANLGKTGNVNKAKLEYSNNCNLNDQGEAQDSGTENTEETEWDYTIVFTYQVVINKVDKDTKADLSGATFTLEKVTAQGASFDPAKTYTATVSSNDSYIFTFTGLDDGTYKLTETTVPKGYKGLENPIYFTVEATHTDTWDAHNTTGVIPADRNAILTALTGNETTGTLTLAPDTDLTTLSGDVINESWVGDLEISKAVTGTDDDTKGFTFEVTLTTPSGVTLDETYNAVKTSGTTETTTTVTVDASNKFTVTLRKGEKITVKGLPVGTKCSVVEQTHPDGYTNSDGTKEATISKGGLAKLAFTNAYEATGKVSFKARKVFTDGVLSEHEFQIKLTQVTDGTGETAIATFTPVTKTVTAADGVVDFTEVMSFVKNADQNDTGDYWFMLEEVLPDGVTAANPTKDGITYDTNKVIIKVTVADAKDGNLTVTKTVGSATIGENDLDATFTNQQLGGVQVTKTFTGIKKLPDNFQINVAYSPAVTGKPTVLKANNATSGSATATLSNGAYSGSLVWEIEDLPIGTKVTFTEANYENSDFEVTTKARGTTNAVSVTATAAKKGANGYTGYALGAFTNTYERKTGDLVIRKHVAVAFGDTADDVDFTFKVQLLPPEDVTFNVNVDLFAYEIYDSSDAKQSEGSITPSDLNSTGIAIKDGQYIVVKDLPTGTTYTVTEVINDPGYSLSNSNISGIIDVDVSKNTNLVTNNFSAKSTSVKFGGKKTIAGTSITDQVFVFELYDATDAQYTLANTTPRETRTAGNIAEGEAGQSFEFSAIVYEYGDYTVDSTHYYVVKEKALSPSNGWTIDPKEYHLKVEITRAGDQLKSSVTVTTVDGDTSTTGQPSAAAPSSRASCPAAPSRGRISPARSPPAAPARSRSGRIRSEGIRCRHHIRSGHIPVQGILPFPGAPPAAPRCKPAAARRSIHSGAPPPRSASCWRKRGPRLHSASASPPGSPVQVPGRAVPFSGFVWPVPPCSALPPFHFVFLHSLSCFFPLNAVSVSQT